MNKFICAGSIVMDNERNKTGRVIVVDPVSKFAVIRGNNSYWTQWFRYLEVTSYREVE